MKPAEGTVLTVSRLAAKRAVEAATEHNSAEYVLQAAIEDKPRESAPCATPAERSKPRA